MPRTKRPPLQPTQEQLEIAARRLAKPGRFDSLDEALASPHWSRLVRCMASAIAERQRRQLAASAPAHTQPRDLPTTKAAPRRPPMAPRAPRSSSLQHQFDARRAAANDLEDLDDDSPASA